MKEGRKEGRKGREGGEDGAKLHLHSLLHSALCGDEWSTSSPGHLNPGKEEWYPLNRRLGGPKSPPGLLKNRKVSFPLPGIEFRIVQPIA